MDKRQAVEFLEYLRQDRNLERTIYGDALNMAIEALKAQLSQEGTTKDAISRQAALEKVRAMKAYKLFEDIILVDKAEVQTELMMLSPVQPEVLACGNGELVAKPEPQWIPIERELPRDGSWNIFTDGKNISVERYKADAIDHFFPNGRWFQLEDVIAWMPLPEPYQKGATP